MSLELFYDVCEVCNEKSLGKVFVDLARDDDLEIKSIPFFKCLNCKSLLVANSVLEMIDEIAERITTTTVFSQNDLDQRISFLESEDKDFEQRYLHSWEMIRVDGRESWEVKILEK